MMMTWRAFKENIKYNTRHAVSPFLTQFLDESYKHYNLTWKDKPTKSNAKWEPYSTMAWHNLKLLYHYRKNNKYSFDGSFGTPEGWDAAIIKMEKAFVYILREDEDWELNFDNPKAYEDYQEGMLLFATYFRSLWI